MFSMAIPLAKGSADQAHPAAEKSTDRSFETQASLLPLRVGFTVAETIDLFVNRTARVKWPNDVYLEDQKVSGILIEVVSAQDSQCNQQVAIIGIGINCQVDFQHASPDLQATATSIHAWARPGAAETSSPESVLLEFLNRWLDQEGRNSSEPDWLLQNWSKRGFLNEMWVEVQQATSSVSGICRGISRQGGLLLEDQKHLLLEVIAGTVVSYHRI